MPQILQANFAVINASSNGDNTVITGVTGKPIKVWQIFFTAAGAVNVTFKNGASISQSGAVQLTGAGSSFFAQYTGMPWSWTDPGNNWVINLSGAVALAGTAYYTIGG